MNRKIGNSSFKTNQMYQFAKSVGHRVGLSKYFINTHPDENNHYDRVRCSSYPKSYVRLDE